MRYWNEHNRYLPWLRMPARRQRGTADWLPKLRLAGGLLLSFSFSFLWLWHCSTPAQAKRIAIVYLALGLASISLRERMLRAQRAVDPARLEELQAVGIPPVEVLEGLAYHEIRTALPLGMVATLAVGGLVSVELGLALGAAWAAFTLAGVYLPVWHRLCLRDGGQGLGREAWPALGLTQLSVVVGSGLSFAAGVGAAGLLLTLWLRRCCLRRLSGQAVSGGRRAGFRSLWSGPVENAWTWRQLQRRRPFWDWVLLATLGLGMPLSCLLTLSVLPGPASAELMPVFLFSVLASSWLLVSLSSSRDQLDPGWEAVCLTRLDRRDLILAHLALTFPQRLFLSGAAALAAGLRFGPAGAGLAAGVVYALSRWLVARAQWNRERKSGWSDIPVSLAYLGLFFSPYSPLRWSFDLQALMLGGMAGVAWVLTQQRLERSRGQALRLPE